MFSNYPLNQFSDHYEQDWSSENNNYNKEDTDDLYFDESFMSNPFESDIPNLFINNSSEHLSTALNESLLASNAEIPTSDTQMHESDLPTLASDTQIQQSDLPIPTSDTQIQQSNPRSFVKKQKKTIYEMSDRVIRFREEYYYHFKGNKNLRARKELVMLYHKQVISRLQQKGIKIRDTNRDEQREGQKYFISFEPYKNYIMSEIYELEKENIINYERDLEELKRKKASKQKIII